MTTATIPMSEFPTIEIPRRPSRFSAPRVVVQCGSLAEAKAEFATQTAAWWTRATVSMKVEHSMGVPVAWTVVVSGPVAHTPDESCASCGTDCAGRTCPATW